MINLFRKLQKYLQRFDVFNYPRNMVEFVNKQHLTFFLVGLAPWKRALEIRQNEIIYTGSDTGKGFFLWILCKCVCTKKYIMLN